MKDAAQIRRCNGALCANQLLFQIPNPKISNREPLRLEMHVTHTKQRADPRSNREKQTIFKSTRRGGPTAPFADAPPGFRPSFRPSFLLPQSACAPHHIAPTPNLLPQNPNLQSPQKPKTAKIPHRSLFRLERTPTLCFLQLTRIFK